MYYVTQDSESKVTGAMKLAGELQWDKRPMQSVGGWSLFLKIFQFY